MIRDNGSSSCKFLEIIALFFYSFVASVRIFSACDHYSYPVFPCPSFQATSCTRARVPPQARVPFFQTNFIFLSELIANCQSGRESAGLTILAENAPQRTSGDSYMDILSP